MIHNILCCKYRNLGRRAASCLQEHSGRVCRTIAAVGMKTNPMAAAAANCAQDSQIKHGVNPFQMKKTSILEVLHCLLATTRIYHQTIALQLQVDRPATSINILSRETTLMKHWSCSRTQKVDRHSRCARRGGIRVFGRRTQDLRPLCSQFLDKQSAFREVEIMDTNTAKLVWILACSCNTIALRPPVCWAQGAPSASKFSRCMYGIAMKSFPWPGSWHVCWCIDALILMLSTVKDILHRQLVKSIWPVPEILRTSCVCLCLCLCFN